MPTPHYNERNRSFCSSHSDKRETEHPFLSSIVNICEVYDRYDARLRGYHEAASHRWLGLCGSRCTSAHVWTHATAHACTVCTHERAHCLHGYPHTCVHMCARACTCLHMHAHARTCLHMPTHAYTCPHMPTHSYPSIMTCVAGAPSPSLPWRGSLS